jgi:hypothetical protein
VYASDDAAGEGERALKLSRPTGLTKTSASGQRFGHRFRTCRYAGTQVRWSPFDRVAGGTKNTLTSSRHEPPGRPDRTTPLRARCMPERTKIGQLFFCLVIDVITVFSFLIQRMRSVGAVNRSCVSCPINPQKHRIRTQMGQVFEEGYQFISHCMCTYGPFIKTRPSRHV